MTVPTHIHRHHVIDLLPRYALVALPEPDLRRVEAHLARCAGCRAAFAAVLGELADAAVPAVQPPRPAARAEFLARAGGLRIVPAADAFGANGVRLLPAVESPRGRAPKPAAGLGFARPASALGLRAAAALLLVLVLPVAGWFVGVKAQVDQRNAVYALVTNPAAAHPLDDSDVAADVSGVLYADPAGTTAYLAASGLPPIPADHRYQVWLLTPSEDLVSAGFLEVSPGGDGEALLRTPAPVGEYLAAVVTAEPQVGSPGPTGERTLGGWISR